MIKTENREGILEILLNHPPVNGITEASLDILMAELRRAGTDPDVKAIVIGSALPGRFSAGLDLPKFRETPAAEVHRIASKLYFELHDLQSRLPKPVVAAITGAVRGGGMSIAITCDMIVAADDATFGYPELEVGLLPAIHYHHLPRIIGRYRAFDLLFTGRVFDAPEAMALGLVNRIAPSSDVLAKAREVAALLGSKSPELMRLGKGAFARVTDNGYRQGAASAADQVAAVFGTAACQEGLLAFAQKRKPRWAAG